MESIRKEKRPGDPLENDDWGHDPQQPWGPPPLAAMKAYPMPKPAGSPRPHDPTPPHSARSNASGSSLPSAVSYPSSRSPAPSRAPSPERPVPTPRPRDHSRSPREVYPEPADTSNRRAPKATPMAVPNHSPRTHASEPSDTSNTRVLGVTSESAAKGHAKAEKRPPSPSEEDTANVPASAASTAKPPKTRRQLK